MIISQTPFRISFFGGGTDYPTWYREHGGAVLSTTINKYAYITCRHLPPFFEHKHRFVYSQIENINDLDMIKHPAIRAILKYLKVEEGLEIHYDGDLPARSGIGSSSSFTVGLVNALLALRGQRRSKMELAAEAIHIEQNVIKEAVGSQDQVAAAFGGLSRIDFHEDNTFGVRPVIISRPRAREFNSNLMLFFTGFSRIAATVAQSKISNFGARERQLKLMHEMVTEAEMILQNPKTNLDEIGQMLHEAWTLKKELSDKVSTSSIDDIYEAGMRAGALGGKILGAGGGGFILFYVPPARQDSVRQALNSLIEVDFEFEYGGSQIILYNPDKAIFRGRRERDWSQTSNQASTPNGGLSNGAPKPSAEASLKM